jgi:multidrug resistance efflux pump
MVVAMLGFLFFQNQAIYVATDNAMVTGALVQVGSPSAGVLRGVNFDIGDEVSRGQIMATIAMTTPQNSPQAPVTQASVRAPIDGVVVARQGNPGEAVTNGKAVFTLVDPTSLWVQAQIDETQVGRVHPGQSVDVTITALGQTFPGRVATVGLASSSASQAMQGINLPGVQRTAQLVPVRVEVDYGDLPLVLGSSAAVKIRVQE